MRPPARAPPPAAARSPAEGYFTRMNQSAAVLGAHPSQSGAAGLALSRLSAESPRCAFAPLSATGLGIRKSGGQPLRILLFELKRGNALARACVYPRGSPTPHRLRQIFFSGMCLSNTCLVLFFCLHVFYVCFAYIDSYEISLFSEYEILTAELENPKCTGIIPGSLLFWVVTQYVIIRRKCPTLSEHVRVTSPRLPATPATSRQRELVVSEGKRARPGCPSFIYNIYIILIV